MASLDQLNFEKMFPGVPFNPPKPTGPVGYQGMTAEQIAGERLREFTGKPSDYYVGMKAASAGTSAYPPAGTPAGYELSGDKKQRRMRFHDGKGGFTYGPFEPNPDYREEDDTEKARKDAFELLRDVFNSYGLSELSDLITSYMKEGIGTGEATVRLKQSQPYKDRFYGNELRLASGRNVIDEASYLDLENSYSETLKAYGLQDYFGTGVTPNERKNRQKAIANVIGADISAVEFKDRVSTAVDRVKMADPATKSAFQQFYGIGESELAKYFLDPTKTLVTLKEKAAAAEIGGAAIGQGLSATMATAEDLARYGISREQAQVGYAKIGEILPGAARLGGIYGEEGITYGQTEAEAETFKGLASAQRKRERLIAKETAQFGGSAGVGQAGLSTTYLRKGSSAGQF